MPQFTGVKAVLLGFDEKTWGRFFLAGSRGEGERRHNWLKERAAGEGTTPADRGWTRGRDDARHGGGTDALRHEIFFNQIFVFPPHIAP
jgi:hypothetical protein